MSRHFQPGRRQFLGKALAASVAVPFMTSSFGQAGTACAAEPAARGPKRPGMKLSFMTFVCPDWTIDRIVKFAKEAGYDGVEIRVDARHKHGISSTSSAQTRREVKKLFAGEGVGVAAVATSVQLAVADAAAHKKHLDAAKANLDLAADLGAPVVRIFAGGGKPMTPKIADQVAAAFDALGDYSKASGACPILECGHDIIKGWQEAAEVLRRVHTSNFGALWNHAKMDDATFAALKARLRHFHVHDDVLDPKSTDIVDLARRGKSIGFRGYVSLEIIKGKNVPEELLKEVATRLQGQIAKGEA